MYRNMNTSHFVFDLRGPESEYERYARIEREKAMTEAHALELNARKVEWEARTLEMKACKLEMERSFSKFAVAIRPHDIKGICRHQIWREWESQGRPTISAEWIRMLVANRHVEFVFEDLSCFNQLNASADGKWVKPRLHHVPVFNCAHGCSRY